jgi:carbon storage regulator
MLVLSRRTDETIAIPDLGITIKVIKVKGKTVSIGIEAPDQIQILRGELVESATSFNDSQLIPSTIQYSNSATSASGTTTV